MRIVIVRSSCNTCNRSTKKGFTPTAFTITQSRIRCCVSFHHSDKEIADVTDNRRLRCQSQNCKEVKKLERIAAVFICVVQEWILQTAQELPGNCAVMVRIQTNRPKLRSFVTAEFFAVHFRWCSFPAVPIQTGP